jgi:3-oxoacyl-[acyl-carrier protein] reductase
MSGENKVAIVTGAGRRWGMGWQIASGLAKKGLDIAVADIREDWGKESANSISQETGRRAVFFKTDVASRDSVASMMAAVAKEFGRIDALVNDAAISPRVMVDDITDQHYDQVMNINFRGTVLTCQAVLPHMRKQGGGRIVNIASGGALQPIRGLLAQEVARDNIVVTVVAPGVMHTAMGSESGPSQEEFERQGRHQLFKRPLYPAEVAEVVIYAATHPTHVLTGQTLHANGGGYMV